MGELHRHAGAALLIAEVNTRICLIELAEIILPTRG
jgi:hypothetical protein